LATGRGGRKLKREGGARRVKGGPDPCLLGLGEWEDGPTQGRIRKKKKVGQEGGENGKRGKLQ